MPNINPEIRYTEEEALKEADLMRDKIEKGEAKDYNEAGEKIESKDLEIDINNFSTADLKNVPSEYRKQIALKLIETKSRWRNVADNIKQFQDFDREVVEKLIKNGFGWYIKEDTDCKFGDVDPIETRLMIAEREKAQDKQEAYKFYNNSADNSYNKSWVEDAREYQRELGRLSESMCSKMAKDKDGCKKLFKTLLNNKNYKEMVKEFLSGLLLSEDNNNDDILQLEVPQPILAETIKYLVNEKFWPTCRWGKGNYSNLVAKINNLAEFKPAFLPIIKNSIIKGLKFNSEQLETIFRVKEVYFGNFLQSLQGLLKGFNFLQEEEKKDLIKNIIIQMPATVYGMMHDGKLNEEFFNEGTKKTDPVLSFEDIKNEMVYYHLLANPDKIDAADDRETRNIYESLKANNDSPETNMLIYEFIKRQCLKRPGLRETYLDYFAGDNNINGWGGVKWNGLTKEQLEAKFNNELNVCLDRQNTIQSKEQLFSYLREGNFYYDFYNLMDNRYSLKDYYKRSFEINLKDYDKHKHDEKAKEDDYDDGIKLMEVIRDGFLKCLSKGDISTAQMFKKHFLKMDIEQDDFLNKTKEAAKNGLTVNILRGNKIKAKFIKAEYDITENDIDFSAIEPELIEQSLTDALQEKFNGKPTENVFEIMDKVKPNKEILQSKEVTGALKNELVYCLIRNDDKRLFLLLDNFDVKDNIKKEAVKKSIVELLGKDNFSGIERIIDLNLIQKDKLVLNVEEVDRIIFKNNNGWILAKHLDSLIFQNYVDNLKSKISNDYYEKYLDKIKQSLRDNQGITLTRKDTEDLESSKLMQLSFAEINFLCSVQELNKYSLNSSEEAKNVYQELKDKTKDRQDEEINKRFEMGGEAFGYHRMFEFAKPGNRHDALYAFDKIIELYQKSGLPPQQFFNNILRQVASQDGMLGGATYYQALNDVASSFDANYEEVFQEAKKYDLEELNRLIQEIGEPKNIFSSLKTLRNYHELTKQLREKDILREIKDEPNQRLKKYVSALLLHPTIEDKQAVLDFYKNPAEFLGLDSSHTSGEIHDRKKPSNYTEIPNLDLDATDMRDALVEGVLDKIQVWQPLEIYYELPQNLDKYHQFVGQDIKKIISEALGKRGEIKGKANNPEKMAKSIADILQIKLSDLGKAINGESAISEEQKNKIVNLLYFDRFGYANKTEKYLAKINLKSDPDGVVAGNDTKCCMPFGDGKNTLYTYNPICSLFILQKETGDGRYATIGQSVLTKDKNIGVKITKLRDALEQDQMKLQELIPEGVLRQTKSIIAADSVEVNANYHNEKYSQIIADLYKDFFAEYLTRFAKEQNLDESKVVTGSCSYRLTGLGSEANYFIPESPVAYSDKYKDDVGVLDLTKKWTEYFKKQVKTEKINKKPQKKESLIDESNVQYLTFQDTLPTAYLEGKVYQHTTMREGLHNMENGLIAKDINNAQKDRPNMSLKYVSPDGKMQAYLIAYEGKANQQQLEDTSWFEQECIYVADLAKSAESIKAGVALVNGFVELYDKNYLNKDKPLPIVARMRDTTSFRLVNKKLDKLTAGTGKKFVMEEILTEQDGDDLMHWVVVKPE